MDRTENFGLPIYADTDVVNPKNDTNDAFENLDSAVKSLENAAAGGFGVVKDVQELQEKMAQVESKLEEMSTQITDLEGDIVALQADMKELQNREYTMFGNGVVKYVTSGSQQ